MQCLEVSGAVRLIYRLLGVKGLKDTVELNMLCTNDIRVLVRASKMKMANK